MQDINPGDTVTYTEYEIAPMSGRKIASRRMENMVVAAVIQPGEFLTEDRAREYFGDELTAEEYRGVMVSGNTRLILKDDEGTPYCVTLADDFLKNGLQTLEVAAGAPPAAQIEAPNYLQFMNAFAGGMSIGTNEGNL